MIQPTISSAAIVLVLCSPLGLSAGQAPKGEAPKETSHGSDAGLERSKELVRTYYQRVWNEGDLSALEGLFSPEYDREGLKDTISLFEWGFPDVSIRVVDLIAEGDRVVAFWVAEARHEGAIFGIEPTGAWVTVRGIEIFRVADGQIVEDWQVWDRFGLLEQLRRASAITSPEEVKP